MMPQMFNFDALAMMTASCIAFFAGLTFLYSWKSMAGARRSYHLYLLLSLAAALGAVLTRHLVVLLVCWGLSGVFLYLLIGCGAKERTPATSTREPSKRTAGMTDCSGTQSWA